MSVSAPTSGIQGEDRPAAAWCALRGFLKLFVGTHAYPQNLD